MTLSHVMSTMESSSQHNFGIASPVDMAVGSYQLMVKGFSWCVSLWDQIAITQTRFTTLPPIFLRHRVHGDIDLTSFLNVGEQCLNDLEAALYKIDKKITDFTTILDFGCGCGRTLLWLTERAKDAQLFGTDIDREAIAWCQTHLNAVTYTVNDALPPLAFPDAHFDLVYAISIFTHLDADFQHRWLGELKRVTKPDGMVLITVHGPERIRELTPELQDEVKAKGLLFIPFPLQRGIFPEWYQLSFHTPEYAIETFSNYFQVLAYVPLGLNQYQDLMVLKNTL